MKANLGKLCQTKSDIITILKGADFNKEPNFFSIVEFIVHFLFLAMVFSWHSKEVKAKILLWSAICAGLPFALVCHCFILFEAMGHSVERRFRSQCTPNAFMDS